MLSVIFHFQLTKHIPDILINTNKKCIQHYIWCIEPLISRTEIRHFFDNAPYKDLYMICIILHVKLLQKFFVMKEKLCMSFM